MSPGDGYFRRQRSRRHLIRWVMIGWIVFGVLLGIGYMVGQMTG